MIMSGALLSQVGRRTQKRQQTDDVDKNPLAAAVPWHGMACTSFQRARTTSAGGKGGEGTPLLLLLPIELGCGDPKVHIRVPNYLLNWRLPRDQDDFEMRQLIFFQVQVNFVPTEVIYCNNCASCNE